MFKHNKTIQMHFDLKKYCEGHIFCLYSKSNIYYTLSYSNEPLDCKLYGDFSQALNDCNGETFIMTVNLNSIDIKITNKNFDYYANKVKVVKAEKIFDNYQYSLILCKKNKTLLKFVSEEVRTPQFEKELVVDAIERNNLYNFYWIKEIKQTDEICKMLLDFNPQVINYITHNLVDWSKFILEKDIHNFRYIPFKKMSDDEACDIYNIGLKLGKEEYLESLLDITVIPKLKKVYNVVKYYKNMLKHKGIHELLDIYHVDYTKVITTEELCQIVVTSLEIDKENTYRFIAEIFANYDIMYKDFCNSIVKMIDYDDYLIWANS